MFGQSLLLKLSQIGIGETISNGGNKSERYGPRATLRPRQSQLHTFKMLMKRRIHITRPKCALDRRTILCLNVPGFQSQVFKHVKILSERSKKVKEQKNNKGSFLVAESAYNSQHPQFGFVMQQFRNNFGIYSNATKTNNNLEPFDSNTKNP